MLVHEDDLARVAAELAAGAQPLSERCVPRR
jgi:hypothetical protein